MKSRQIALVIVASLAVIALWPRCAEADNIVRISDTAIAAGDKFVLDVELETSSFLSGWNILLRWSSADVRCDSAVIEPSQFGPRLLAVAVPIDYGNRVIRFALIPLDQNRPYPFVSPGRYTAARLFFSSSSAAIDQIAFVDSAIVQQSGAPQKSTFATLNNTQILPAFVPGTITIGHPAAATMRVLPAALSFRGEIGGLDPRGQVLSITSSTGALFDWSAHGNSAWLDISSPAGKAPAYPEITVDLFGLDLGLYYDTITVESPRAQNSPIRIPVTLRVDTASSRPPIDVGFELFQNHPNPFVTYHDPETEIRYYLKDSDHVQIRIYDAMGRPIRTLFSGYLAGGDRTLRWDGRDQNGIIVASGHYFCRMTTSKGTITKPMVVIK